jgi:hypothetical protein
LLIPSPRPPVSSLEKRIFPFSEKGDNINREFFPEKSQESEMTPKMGIKNFWGFLWIWGVI